MSGPERIWIDQDTWFDRKAYSRVTEYLRADLHQSALRAEREKALREAAAEARRFANIYDQGSDGRNTFTLLAERFDALIPKDGEKP